VSTPQEEKNNSFGCTIPVLEGVPQPNPSRICGVVNGQPTHQGGMNGNQKHLAESKGGVCGDWSEIVHNTNPSAKRIRRLGNNRLVSPWGDLESVSSRPVFFGKNFRSTNRTPNSRRRKRKSNWGGCGPIGSQGLAGGRRKNPVKVPTKGPGGGT